MIGPIRALLASVSFFTVVPVPPLHEVDRDVARAAIITLPWLGLGIGIISAWVGGLLWWSGAGHLLAAVGAIAVSAAITGAMHLDGVADTADGLGSRKPPKQALALMKKSDIGPMGVSVLLLVLLVQVAALVSPALSGWGFVALVLSMPMVGRLPVIAGCSRPGVRVGGFGALFTGSTSQTDWLVNAILGLSVVSGVAMMTGLGLGEGWVIALVLPVAALLAWAAAFGWERHVFRRIGCLTGDVFGSIIELTQTVYLVVAVVMLGVAG